MTQIFSSAALQRRFFSPCGAALLCLFSLSACSPTPAPGLPTNICELTLPPIGQVQGRGEVSPQVAQEVTVRAVVTALVPGEGFFIHDPRGDGDPASSEGLWIQDAGLPPFPGELWAWRGKVAELDDHNGASLTSLIEISGRQKCAEELPLPLGQFPLPSSQREALESMHVQLASALRVAQAPSERHPYQIQVATETLFAPTELVRPGSAAQILEQRFKAASMLVSLPPGRHDYRTGDYLEALTGVYDLRTQAQLLASSAPAISQAQPSAPKPPSSPGLRLVSMNLLNYFNGDGQGGGFPTTRGAKTAPEFHQQRARIVAAIVALDAGIIAVQELENDGYGEFSAAQDLSQALNQAQSGANWHFIQAYPEASQALGTDSISVGLFYRADRVKPVGTTQILQSGDFGTRHRPVLAQAFQWQETQPPLLVAAVHLKSKGGCPHPAESDDADATRFDAANADQGDGQACWNLARTQGASELAQWLKLQAPAGGAIVLGDFNSYRMEDPPRAMVRAGLVELVGHSAEPPLFSYVYRGAQGTLDYAFATPNLLPQLAQAQHWHVNAQESELAPSASENLPAWARFSDHDPLWVDLSP